MDCKLVHCRLPFVDRETDSQHGCIPCKPQLVKGRSRIWSCTWFCLLDGNFKCHPTCAHGMFLQTEIWKWSLGIFFSSLSTFNVFGISVHFSFMMHLEFNYFFSFLLPSFNTKLFNLSIVDIEGWVIFCCLATSLISALGMQASATRCDHQNCFQTLPSVPEGSRTTNLPQLSEFLA